MKAEEPGSHEYPARAVFALLSLMLSVLATGCGERQGQEDVAVPDAGVVRTFEVTSRRHLSGGFRYEQTPPVGGDHSAAWQECGYYERSINN